MKVENSIICECTNTNVANSLLIVLPQQTQYLKLTTEIYGISIARRIALSAKSAGFDRVLLLTTNDQIEETAKLLENTPALAISPENVSVHLDARRIVILASDILADRKWLKYIGGLHIQAGSMVLDPQRAGIIEAEPDAEFIAQSFAGGGDIFAALQDTFKTQLVDLSGPGSIALQPTTTKTDVEDWLRSCLIKDTDGVLARIIARPISLEITRHLINTRISANAMSVFSASIGLCGAPFFLSTQPEYQVIGGLLFTLHSILDGCDGELARLRFSESHLGGLLDYWGDNIVHVAIFACMSIGWGLSADASWSHWPLIAGCAAVFSTIGSASLVHWRTMRRSKHTHKKAEGPLFTSIAQSSNTDISKLLDGLARRDFIYLVLLLSIFGKASWFLVLAAIGAPVFFLLLLWVAYSETKLKTQ